MTKTLLDAYTLFHHGSLALQRAEQAGLRVDIEYCERMNKELTEEISKLKAKFEKSELWALWSKKYMGKAKLESNPQLETILYKDLAITPPTKTKKGRGSTTEATLQKIDVPGLDLILEMRKLRKIRDTYLAAFVREAVNGYIHPFYSLHSVRTYRSSSDSPNFQNIPKRDKKALEICRRAIYPRPGNRLMEVDYSGIEVRVAACITGDKKLAQDVIDGDMHKDMAIELYKLPDLDKRHPGDARLRQGAKNGFVFPQFYGDYYKNNVPILMEWAENVKLKSGETAYEHMKDVGLIRMSKSGNVTSVDPFLKHVQVVEKRFWSERYKAYGKWKESAWKSFQRTGLIKFPTGFEATGDLSPNEVNNTPIQGSAFHCLLWSLIHLDRIMMKERWKTRIVGQIHDAILLDVNPYELEHVAKTVKEVMVDRLTEAWDWITVPLEVEAEVFPVDGCWIEGEAYEV